MVTRSDIDAIDICTPNDSHAEIALELLDRLGHRRLGDREVLGGARDRSLFGDGDEILQLTEGEGHGSFKHGARREARRSS